MRRRARALSAVVRGAFAAHANATTAGAYVADPAQSRLEFTGEQAGAPFTGVFHRFTANVDFSPEGLGSARFDVSIEMNSLDSMDKERDTTMRGADLFDVAHAPTSRYLTHGFAKTAGGYTAIGTLTLHGVSREVPVEFQFTPTPAGARLVGSATLKRLDFGVGQGDWKSTEWVGNAVQVRFTLVLKPRD